jgi:acetyltransferase
VPVVESYSSGSDELPGFPLVAKYGATSDVVVHKASAGLVRLGLRTSVELAQAVAEIELQAAELGLAPDEVVVQSQLEGIELFLGAKRDPSFGPVVLCGVGGGLVELIGDVLIWPAPFTHEELAHLWRQSMVSRLVGSRLEVRRLAVWLAGLGRLLEERPEIQSIDVNPVVLTDAGAWAVDARVVVTPRSDSGRRLK